MTNRSRWMWSLMALMLATAAVTAQVAPAGQSSKTWVGKAAEVED